MFIKEKLINGTTVYIKSDRYSLDAVYEKDGQTTSFMNYGTYYSLSLFEFEDKLFVIRRSERDTCAYSVVVRDDGVATWGQYYDSFFFGRRWLNDQEVEKVFKNNRSYFLK